MCTPAIGSPVPAAVTRPEICCCARAGAMPTSKSATASSHFPSRHELGVDIGLRGSTEEPGSEPAMALGVVSEPGTARTYSKHFDNARSPIGGTIAPRAAGLAGRSTSAHGRDPPQSARLLSGWTQGSLHPGGGRSDVLHPDPRPEGHGFHGPDRPAPRHGPGLGHHTRRGFLGATDPRTVRRPRSGARGFAPLRDPAPRARAAGAGRIEGVLLPARVAAARAPLRRQ